MDYAHERRYIGNDAQLFSVKEYTLTQGKARGVRAVDVSTAAGLDYTVLPDRCMDIHQVRFHGKNACLLTPTGIVAPAYYDDASEGLLKSFTGGFLTTCGFENIGKPSDCDGVPLGMHGSLSQTPAERLSVGVEEGGGRPMVVLSGTVRSARFFGHNLTLKRTILSAYDEAGFFIRDEITNRGFQTAPFMLLYHFNIGYPLLSEQARMVIPSVSVRGRDAYAQERIGSWDELTPPQAGCAEVCYYHDVQADEDGIAAVGVVNPQLGQKLQIRFDKKVLDHFVEWKMMGEGDYALGLEPGNATIDGYAQAKRDGTLKTLAPGQTIVSTIQVSFETLRQ